MPLTRFQPDHYDELLAAKVAAITPDFAALGAPAPEIFASPPEGFRMRAEFRIWHEGDRSDYVMFPRGDSRTPIVIDDFPFASATIRALMPPLREAFTTNDTLRRKLFQVEFLSTLSGEALVTLIYHRPLDADWEQAAARLAADLGANIIGRSRKQKRVIGEDWVDERLIISGRRFTFRQPDGAFTQPNARVNAAMVAWACSQARGCSDDLLELYCGIGNFTLPLASHFRRVLATELSKPATAAAEFNRRANGISNVEFARLSAEEMTQALSGARVFRRLAHLQQPLADFSFSTLFVDPPRAGLDPATESLAAGFENILYISCNPETLHNNLQRLSETHRIIAFAAFDQFPYTDHLECGTFLTRRTTHA